MLTACFDGSGKEDVHDVVGVCGFASMADVWSEFEVLWQERLERDGLSHFHAADFAHSTGEFKKVWRGNEERRRALLADLMSIIKGCGLRKFGYMMIVQNFKDSPWPQSVPEDKPLLFGHLGVLAVEQFNKYAVREKMSNVQYVFEKGDPEWALRELMKGRGLIDPVFKWPKPHTDRKGISHDPFLGLQAADWITYEYTLEYQRLWESCDEHIRWARGEFDSILGDIRISRHGSIEQAVQKAPWY